MHSLVEADFNILLYNADIYEFGLAITDEELQVQVPAVNQFLQAIGHVKLLRLFMDYPGLPLLSHKQFLPFVNLAYLETFDKCWLTPGTGLFKFLESVLNLQTLQIHHLGQVQTNSFFETWIWLKTFLHFPFSLFVFQFGFKDLMQIGFHPEKCLPVCYFSSRRLKFEVSNAMNICLT